MNKNKEMIAGIMTIFLIGVGLWINGRWLGLLYGLIILLTAQLVLYLLKKNTASSKTWAVVLMPAVIFLFFMPRAIREAQKELQEKEKSE